MKTTHNLDFEVAPWERNPAFARFRVGTVTGLWCSDKTHYKILAITNHEPGNGHLKDVFEYFIHSCRRDNKDFMILEVWNKKFKNHLINKLGFKMSGDDDVELKIQNSKCSQVKIEKNRADRTRFSHFSKDRKYRYVLWRIWDESLPLVMFIGLNPSTADENQNDPTIKKVIKIARNNGYGGVYMLNLFPYITSKPNKLNLSGRVHMAVNYNIVLNSRLECQDVVFAWGNFKQAEEKSKEIKEIFPNALCLHINKNGSPKHPLCCKDDSKLIPYK